MTSLTPYLARAILQSNLRGRTRLTLFLARRLGSLQSVPVTLPHGTLYADLRVASAHHVFAGLPADANEEGLIKEVVRPGQTVYDVGAHIGELALLMSHLVGPRGRVYAFEPNAELLHALGRTVEGAGNIRLFPFGLSDENRSATLYVPADPSMASLADWTRGRAGETHTVSCELRVMDELVTGGTIPPPDFIKCDVEGAEYQVFRGGARTIDREDAPLILFEASARTSEGFGQTASQGMEFLRGLAAPRYRFFAVRERGTLSPLKESLVAAHDNLLAVPAAKLGLVGGLVR